MEMMLIAAAAIAGICPVRGGLQEDWSPSLYSVQDETPPVPERVQRPDLPGPPEGSADLWYGIPGVRPGGDLLGPILDLVRHPSGLLDFRPRNVPSYLLDRETAEFLRERR